MHFCYCLLLLYYCSITLLLLHHYYNIITTSLPNEYNFITTLFVYYYFIITAVNHYSIITSSVLQHYYSITTALLHHYSMRHFHYCMVILEAYYFFITTITTWIHYFPVNYFHYFHYFPPQLGDVTHSGWAARDKLAASTSTLLNQNITHTRSVIVSLAPCRATARSPLAGRPEQFYEWSWAILLLADLAPSYFLQGHPARPHTRWLGC